MKNIVIITLLLCQSFLLFAQEHEDLYFLETDSTWIKEMFVFPIRFAPTIDYKGVEDARFPEGWSKKDSSTFWSYAFAWNIDHDGELIEKELEGNLKIYFDGLMGKDNSMVLILKKEEDNDLSRFIGKVRTFDNFREKKMMTLNVTVENHFCEEKKKAVILFRFSPKEFGHDVWKKLDEVRLPVGTDVCDF